MGIVVNHPAAHNISFPDLLAKFDVVPSAVS